MSLSLTISVGLILIGFVLYRLSNPIIDEIVKTMKENNEELSDIHPVYWILCWFISLAFMSIGFIYLMVSFIR